MGMTTTLQSISKKEIEEVHKVRRLLENHLDARQRFLEDGSLWGETARFADLLSRTNATQRRIIVDFGPDGVQVDLINLGITNDLFEAIVGEQVFQLLQDRYEDLIEPVEVWNLGGSDYVRHHHHHNVHLKWTALDDSETADDFIANYGRGYAEGTHCAADVRDGWANCYRSAKPDNLWCRARLATPEESYTFMLRHEKAFRSTPSGGFVLYEQIAEYFGG